MVLYLSTISYAPVAQLVEHLTFNQGVRDSSSRRSTKKRYTTCGCFSFFAFCGMRIPSLEERGIRNIAEPLAKREPRSGAKFPQERPHEAVTNFYKNL